MKINSPIDVRGIKKIIIDEDIMWELDQIFEVFVLSTHKGCKKKQHIKTREEMAVYVNRLISDPDRESSINLDAIITKLKEE